MNPLTMAPENIAPGPADFAMQAFLRWRSAFAPVETKSRAQPEKLSAFDALRRSREETQLIDENLPPRAPAPPPPSGLPVDAIAKQMELVHEHYALGLHHLAQGFDPEGPDHAIQTNQLRFLWQQGVLSEADKRWLIEKKGLPATLFRPREIIPPPAPPRQEATERAPRLGHLAALLIGMAREITRNKHNSEVIVAQLKHLAQFMRTAAPDIDLREIFASEPTDSPLPPRPMSANDLYERAAALSEVFDHKGQLSTVQDVQRMKQTSRDQVRANAQAILATQHISGALVEGDNLEDHRAIARQVLAILNQAEKGSH